MTPESKEKKPYSKVCSCCKRDKTPRAFRFARPFQLREICNACYLKGLSADQTGKRVQTAEAKRTINPATAAKIRAAIATRKAKAARKESKRKSAQMTEYHAKRRFRFASGVKE